jgi:hypothetical protein
MPAKFYSETLKGRYQWGELELDGTVILKLILNK